MLPKQPIICFLTTDSQAIALSFEYWARTDDLSWQQSVSSIAKKYRLTQYQLTQLVKQTSIASRPDRRCSQCDTPYTCNSRSAYQSPPLGRNGSYICGECLQYQAQEAYRLRKAKESEDFEKIKNILGDQDNHPPKFDYCSITQELAAYIYAILLANNQQESPIILEPIPNQPGTLLATHNGTVELYKMLNKAGIIVPSIHSDTGTFEITDSEVRYYIDRARWVVAEDTSGMTMPEVIELLKLILDDPRPEDISAIWDRIAIDECREYFEHLYYEKYGFNQVGYSEKVEHSINYCLDKISIPQTKNILYSTMRNIAALMQEKNYHKTHVYNMIPGNIVRNVDRYLANNYEIRPWDRKPAHKEAWLTSLLFDSILKGGTKDYQRANRANIKSICSESSREG